MPNTHSALNLGGLVRLNLGVHVICFPSGRYGFVGTLPRTLGTETPATVADIMAGRTYTNSAGAAVVTAFPTFETADLARAHAEDRGIAVRLPAAG